MRPIDEIIVHCTATRPDWWAGKRTSEKVREVKRWHTSPKPKGRGWRDIGYHFLIDRDGTVATGRPLDQEGAHVIGHNTGTIGIALFGGHGASGLDNFSDHFTPEQDTALRRLIADLRQRFPGITTVSGHNQYAAKACPGFRVPLWYPMRKPAPVSHQPSNPPAKPSTPGWLARILAAIFRRNR